MEFAHSPLAQDYINRMTEFMEELVYPSESEYDAYRRQRGPHDQSVPPIIEELKQEARRRGLWNLFLPEAADPAHGLRTVDYAPIAEISGRSPHIAPEVINCSPPDTGNMEVLHHFGTAEQKERWLQPLLDGHIRSAFVMTEPAVASSDARNVRTRIERDVDEYVLNGRKWWISGAADPRAELFVVMGKTDPDAPAHRQQSMILVPRDTPGLEIVRDLPVFGYYDRGGHCELQFTNVRVPVSSIIAGEGDGFMIAQARLGPGRIHHCMRAIGMAERALELLCDRAQSRVAFGKTLSAQGVIQQQIAESRIAIEQARLLTLKTAWMIDTVGVKQARTEIAAIKVIAPRVALDVVDRAVQIHGGGGVSDDFPLASMWAHLRTLRILDGPDEVHIAGIARSEIRSRSLAGW